MPSLAIPYAIQCINTTIDVFMYNNYTHIADKITHSGYNSCVLNYYWK